MNTVLPPQNQTGPGPAEGNLDEEQSGRESDLLALLRGQTEFSLDSYGSLDDVLEGIIEEVSVTLTRFANIEVVTTLEEIKVFSVEDFAPPEGEEDPSVLLVQLHDTEKNPVCAITVPAKLFFFLLEFALGGESDEANPPEGVQISEAENAVFYVFCQCIADGIYEGISAYSDLDKLVSGEAGKVNQVAGWIEENELITVKIDVKIGQFSESILLFVPIEMQIGRASCRERV